MDGSITGFFHRLASGDRAAADALLAYYFPRLVQFANATLRRRGIPTTNGEDAAQSALNSFWLRAQRGQFAAYANQEALWRLLATMTRRKINRQLERAYASKRGGGRVRLVADLPDPHGSDFQIENILEDVPAQDFDLLCEECLERLDAQLRDVAILKILGKENTEIAECLNCSLRTVQRSLQLIRKTWEQELTR